VPAVGVFSLVASLLVLAGCPFPTSADAPLIVRSSSIMLAWDPPATAAFAEIPIASYYVYWRPHPGGGWCLAGQVAADSSPRLRIEHDDLGNGAFDFAVTSIDAMGNESPLHSSIDADADPFGGWYLVWEAPIDPLPEGE
jgi:hypothetical protein